MAYDRLNDKVVFYAGAQSALVFFEKDHYPSGGIDERGIWTWRRDSDHVWRYDLSKRQWFKTDEPLQTHLPIQDDAPGVTKVRTVDGQWKQISCWEAWTSPLLPLGQVLAVPKSENHGYGDLYVWDVSADKPVRVVWRGARSYHSPSPSGRLIVAWIESPTDLLFGWHYTLLDLQDGTSVDSFPYNMKGGEQVEWLRCTQDELEKTLRAMRRAVDEHG
jgi:hypothetical protein